MAALAAQLETLARKHNLVLVEDLAQWAQQVGDQYFGALSALSDSQILREMVSELYRAMAIERLKFDRVGKKRLKLAHAKLSKLE